MIKINRPGLQFRIIVVLSLWVGALSYGLISTFLNDYWIQQWASENAIPLAVTIFSLTISSLILITGWRSKYVKAKKEKTKSKEKQESVEEKRKIREI